MKMKMSRGRGRKGGITGGGRGARETQDYAYTNRSRTTTPLRAPYATRSSTQVAPKLFSRSPQAIVTHTPSLRPALRALKEGEVTATRKPGRSSLPNGHDHLHENSVEKIKPSISTETKHVMELDVTQSLREKSPEVQCHEQTLRSSRCPSQDRSINLTEYARGLQENPSEHLEEVDSDPNHDYVKGHRVKKEIAGLVRAILDKYGDLTGESDVKSPEIISIFFERVCDVYQRLEKKKLFELTSAEIDCMIDELQFFQKGKLKVGWLLEKLQHIYETKRSILRYSEIKREAEKCAEFDIRMDKELEESEMHIALIRKKMYATKEDKIANQARGKEYEKMALDIRAKVHALANQSLVHGLL